MHLLSFPGFMRFHGPGRLGPAVVMVGAAASAIFLFVISPPSRVVVQADCSASSPCPTPTPTPTLAFLTIDVTSGDPNTEITVNGGAFLPNEQMTLYWDQNAHVAGGANADGSGNFVTHVKPFAGDAPGVHRLCASVQPYPCANFTLLAANASPSPSQSPSPSPDTSPTPTQTSTAAPTSTPVATNLNGFDVISRPPFVFLPIVGALAILFALGYWILSVARGPKPTKIPAAAVVHRATRPDYSAGFGAPPGAPAPAPTSHSAWDEGKPAAPGIAPGPAEPGPPSSEPEPPAPDTQAQAQAPQPPELPQPFAEPELPPVDWDVPGDAHSAGPDDPLDFPEPGDE
ncbi:MAG TPA: hypothetical protein VJT78_05420 [Candidatus Dormibacteraeota bacterium]|nr:hypothetical protein [Candidatus Dormibacteraeota bacterium]